jgi:hypothetical protein
MQFFLQNLGYLCKCQKTAQTKQSPKERKFAKSVHRVLDQHDGKKNDKSFGWPLLSDCLSFPGIFVASEGQQI